MKKELNYADKLLIFLFLICVFIIVTGIYFLFNPEKYIALALGNSSECAIYVKQTLNDLNLWGNLQKIYCLEGTSCECEFVLKNNSVIYKEYQKNSKKIPFII